MIFSRSKNRRDAAPRRAQSREPRQSPADDGSQFRRNRTLSGIRHDDGAAPTSERAKAHHLTQKRRKVGGMFLLVLGVVVVLAFLLTQLTARVIVAASSEPLTRPVESSVYESAVNEYFGINPVERLRFVMNEDGLSEYVSAISPEVARVELTSTTSVVESNFTITFRKPLAGWQINGRQYYVDSEGVVFERNYYGNPSVQIVDESGVSPEQGTIVASARLLSFVGRVVSLSGAGEYTVTRAVLPIGSTRQVEIKLKGIRPYVKLTIDRAAGEQVEDMINVLQYLRERRITAEYVDVRIAGRAVYR